MSRYILLPMVSRGPADSLRWLFSSTNGVPGRLIPRWLFLRALAAIYFSAFFSLLFQIKGLIGPDGILPAQQYLSAVAEQLGESRTLVRAVALLAQYRLCHDDGCHVAWSYRLHRRLLQSLAAPQLSHLLYLFPVVHCRIQHFFELPIGRHAA